MLFFCFFKKKFVAGKGEQTLPKKRGILSKFGYEIFNRSHFRREKGNRIISTNYSDVVGSIGRAALGWTFLSGFSYVYGKAKKRGRRGRPPRAGGLTPRRGNRGIGRRKTHPLSAAEGASSSFSSKALKRRWRAKATTIERRVSSPFSTSHSVAESRTRRVQ